MKPIKLIIAGGRDYVNADEIQYALNILIHTGELPSGRFEIELVSGMARGADITAYNLFKSWGMVIHPFPADWYDMSEPCVPKYNKQGKLYNALAGMKRNHAMGDFADVLLAFWDGESKGTKDMINYMETLDKPLTVVRY